jgi:hypothetical protein
LESIKNHPWELGQLRRHFRVASVSLTRAQKEDLYSQLSQKQSCRWAARQALERRLELSKPLIAAYVTKLVAEQAKGPETK